MADSYSTFPEFIDAFVASLSARAALAQKQIADSWPGETQEKESIWIDEVSASDEVAGMRQGPIKGNEVYSVFVICDVLIEGGDVEEASDGFPAKQARDALAVLHGEILREVAEKKRGYTTVSGQVCAARIAGWKFRTYVHDTGRGAASRIEIKVSARR